MKPPKIRILEITGLAHGGSGVHILQLAQRLDRNRFEVEVALMAGSPLEEDFRRLGIPVHATRLDHHGNPWKALLGLLDLGRIVRTGKFDIIHTHTSVAGIVGRLAAKLCSDACVVHMVHALAAQDNLPWLKRTVFHVIERLGDFLTDHYIAGSNFMIERAIAARIFRRDKAVRIYYGIDLSVLKANHLPRVEARRRLGLASDAVVVGFVGRLEEQKGVDLFLRVVAETVKTKPLAEFVIAGNGTLRAKLEALAQELGISSRVRFLGWHKNVAQVVSGIDVVVMPSRWESFGMVAAEAMALGRPIVATRVEGLQEVIVDETTGLFAPPGDVAALARQLRRLLDDPALSAKMSRAGEDRVERNFSVETMVSAHEQLFASFCRHQGSPLVVQTSVC